MGPNLQFPAHLVAFTEEDLQGKLQFLCADILDKPQEQCIGLLFLHFLLLLKTYRWNVAALSSSCQYFFLEDVHLDWLNCFLFFFSHRRSIEMFFAWLFLDIMRMFVSVVSFLVQLDNGIIFQQSLFVWHIMIYEWY